MRIPRALFLLIGSAVIGASASIYAQQGLSNADRFSIALEALKRVESDPATNVVLAEALSNVLQQVQGTPEFVALVKKFKLKDQNSRLLEYAAANPAHEAGVEAIRLVLSAGDLDAVTTALNRDETTAATKLVEALGNAKDKRAVTVLLPFMSDGKRPLSMRKMVVRSLAQTQEGARALVNLAKEGQLPTDLKLTTTDYLHSVRWAEVQAEAEQVLLRPRLKNAQALPSLAELAKMVGNASNGEKIYFNEAVACASCHQVHGRGKEIGPNLSEIGTKLAREALFEAILDPSAGISFGFEAHQLQLKSGDEVYGLLASETSDEIAIKDLQGIVAKYKKAEVALHNQLTTSIMPSGLVESLSTEEFVDLVEYLSSLKKTTP